MTTSDNISAIEAVEKAADAILAKVPQGYGMTRDEALIYAETALSAYPAILAEARKAEALKLEIADLHHILAMARACYFIGRPDCANELVRSTWQLVRTADDAQRALLSKESADAK